MISGKLNSECPESEEFTFTGVASFVIWGNGDVQIMRKVGDSPYLPITDAAGNPATFDNDEPDGVILNVDLENKSRSAKFKLLAETDLEIEYSISWGW